jgi:intein/homing endonuclease
MVSKPKTKVPKPDMAALRNDLTYLARLDGEISGRIKSQDPRTYGLPDLLRPKEDGETEEQLVDRQNREIKDLIEKQLWVLKDARRLAIKLSPPMVDFIATMFYRRANLAILWKGRGSGGTLCAAILVWLCLVYHRMSFTSMAGCLLPGTLVSTRRRGWVPVEDVSDDDEVVGRDGVVRRVVSKTSKEWDGPITKLEPHGFDGNFFTSDHRIWVLRDAVEEDKRGHLVGQDIRRWDTMSPEWVPCGEVTRRDVFVLPRPKRTGVLLPSLMVSTGVGGKGEKVEVPWTPDLCRFIGYWLAEGSVYRLKDGGRFVRFDVGKRDQWLDDLQDLIVRLFGRKPSYDEPGGDLTLEARVRFGSKDVAQFLEDNFGTGAVGKRIPWEMVVGLDDECAMALLAGFLRGDGAVDMTSRGGLDVSLYTVSPALSSGIYWLSLRLGLVPSLGISKPKNRSGFHKVHDGWRMRYGSIDADRLLEEAFGWRSQKERVSRQRRVWVSEDRVYVGVRDVKHSTYQGEVWDLEVEGDPSFSVPMMEVHNSTEQAKLIYQYTKSFWECFPVLSESLLEVDPLQTETRLKNGVILKIISASEKQTRGKHNPGFIVDESCQSSQNVDYLIQAAMQGSMSEPNHMVVVLSTFHYPIGLFQELWDYAEERGFKRFNWDCVLPGTWIITARGLIKIEEVVAGDLVLAENGRFETVERAWSSQVSGGAVRIFPYGWTEGIETTPDHRFKVRRDGRDDWVEASKIREGDDLVFPRPQRAGVSVDHLGSQISPDFARFLGYWYGDGWLDGNRVGISFGDPEKFKEDYLSLVGGLFKADVRLRHREPNEQGRFDNGPLADWMRTVGYRGGEKHVPIEMVLGMSDDALREFVTGMLRTDGCVTLANGVPVVKFTQVSSSVTCAVFLACARLGVFMAVDRRRQSTFVIEGREVSGQDWWMLRSGGRDTDRLMGWLGESTDRVMRNGQHSLDGDVYLTRVRKVERREYAGLVFDLAVKDVHSFSMPWAVAHNCYDSMSPCNEGLLTATEGDPDALEFCRTQCPLTEKRSNLDAEGNQDGWKYIGCGGKARHSEGFQTRANMILAKKMNRGTDVFENEYENNRPKWMQPIYNPELVDQILVPETWPLPSASDAEAPDVVAGRVMGDSGFEIVEKSVGIDWGLEGQTALVLAALIRFHRSRPVVPSKGLPDGPPVDWCIGILESEFLSGKLTSEAIKVLMMWQEMYGENNFFVYGDASHPFNNLEVEQAGFNTNNVQFAKWKDYGVGNCIKYLVTPGKLFIRENLHTLLDQMKRYRRDKFGRPIKKDDHGPDAWMSYLDAKTRVITRSGWTPVGRLGVGVEVLTHAGRFRPIVRYEPARYTRGSLVEVNFAGQTHPVDAHRVTLEHPFQLDDGSWVEAENLKSGMRVRCLASRCARCGMKIPWSRKFCDGCVGKGRNVRWKNPGERERVEAEKKAEALRSEYATGARDAATNARAATAARADMIRSNPGEREKVREHLRAILPLVNTPEKRVRQSHLMKMLHAREGFFDHLRTLEGRENARQRVIARMLADRQIPFNCRLRHFTDIEREMFDSFVRAGFEPVHNLRVGRWFLDVALPELKVAVECDGGNWHNSKQARERDAKKDAYLRGHGWEVFRFSGKRIKDDVDGCRDDVLRVAANHEGLYEFTSIEVVSVKIVEMKRPRTAYHFEVEEDRSYVARGIVSHNCSMLHYRFEERFHEVYDIEAAPPKAASSAMPIPAPVAGAFGVAPVTCSPDFGGDSFSQPVLFGGVQAPAMDRPAGSPIDTRGKSRKTGGNGSVVVI